MPNTKVYDLRCTECPLHGGCITVRLGMVPYIPPGRTPCGGRRAILFVGEAPGANEDMLGTPFVGRAGVRLKASIDYFKFWEKADVYLTNAVRCRPPENNTPTDTQIKLCRRWLRWDLHDLEQRYDEIFVVACGGVASKSLTFCSLTSGLSKQGCKLGTLLPPPLKTRKKGVKKPPPDDVRPPCHVFGHPVYYTYHPSYVNRQPEAAAAVFNHLSLLNDHLEGQTSIAVRAEDLTWAVAPAPPDYPISRLSLDVETYGSLSTPPRQTQFHPQKMLQWDRVVRSRVLATVALSWADPDGVIQSGIFNLTRPDQRRAFLTFLRHATYERVLGQNLLFDLQVLRAFLPDCRRWLNPDQPVVDLLTITSLLDESMPEKSLKALGPLYRITEYEGSCVAKYSSPADPSLHRYNVQDTVATLLIYDRQVERIRGMYGADSEKGSTYCLEWYSKLVWLLVEMSESGIHIDKKYIQDLHTRLHRQRAKMLALAAKQWQWPLRGKGSGAARSKLIHDALDVIHDLHRQHELPPLERTKSKDVSASAANRKACLTLIPVDHDVARRLRLYNAYSDTTGVIDRYTSSLLDGARHGAIQATRLIGNLCYPSWFGVPSVFDDGARGGTKQARIVAKGPAVQTFPPSVKAGIRCRPPYRYLVWADYSQIELRVAALLSEDPTMMEAYTRRLDLHAITAMAEFGPEIADHPKFRSLYRQVGKTSNFLMLFRGGARALQSAILEAVGVYVPMHECREHIRKFWAKYVRLWAWQEEQLRTVRQKGYLELPLIGQSRLFGRTQKDVEAVAGEICNLPIQAQAANVTLSTQMTLSDIFRARTHGSTSRRVLMPLNIYDAIPFEVPADAVDSMEDLCHDTLLCPPYYRDLCDVLGRTVPLAYELKVYDPKGECVGRSWADMVNHFHGDNLNAAC